MKCLLAYYGGRFEEIIKRERPQRGMHMDANI